MSPWKASILHAVSFPAVLIVLAVLAPLLDSTDIVGPQAHLLFTNVAINIVLALGLNLILGLTGQFSLGHAGFLAAGAYASIVLAGKPEFLLPQLTLWHSTLGLPVSMAFSLITITGMVAGMIVAGALGYVVGLPALRLRGDYLAIATLGFGEIMVILINNAPYLGGPTGLGLFGMRNEWLTTGNENAPLYGAIRQYTDNHYYLVSSFLVLATVTFTFYVIRNIKYSTTGRALLAIREDVIASESVGVRTTRYKVTAFVVGAALAGLAGGLLSHHVPLNPTSFTFMRSVELVLIVIIGGQGSITGTILAAIGVTLLPEILRNTMDLNDSLRLVIYALAIILTMLFRQQGIFGRYELPDLVRWAMRKKRGTPAAPSAPAFADARLAHADIPGEGEAGRPVLQVQGMGISFGGLRAVNDFSLTLMPRELVGLIGPNGAGKTTVFNLLTGVYRPEGDVRFHGRSIVGSKPSRISQLGIARTFQNIRLFANLSVLDNVSIAQHAHHKQGMPAAILRPPAFFREEARAREVAMELLACMGLAELAHEQAANLSYGDQRRLEIARALATRPRLLLLDEPAAGMNPTEKRELMELIRKIRDGFHLTILLIEHDMKVVMGICQRIVVLDYGKTIAMGSPAEISRNPAVIEAYLGAVVKEQ